MLNKIIDTIYKVCGFSTHIESDKKITKPIKIIKTSTSLPKTIKEIKWNLIEIRNTIKKLSEEIKELKKNIRQPHVEITCAQHWRLTGLKHEITMLHVLCAIFNNKIHLKQVCKENHCFPCDVNCISRNLEAQQKWFNDNVDFEYLIGEFKMVGEMGESSVA